MADKIHYLGVALLFCAASLYAADTKPTKYLVEYTTDEPCYECGTRLAIFCSPSNSGCDIPVKSVTHFEGFATIEAALEFINRGIASIPSFESGSTIWTGSTWKPVYPRMFIRLLEIREVPVKAEKQVIETPQPPKITEITTYKLGAQK